MRAGFRQGVRRHAAGLLALAETEENERELFEPEQWKEVRKVRAALRRIGIYYFDARPSNVMFPP